MSLLPFNSGMSGIAAEPWKCSKVARVPIASSRFRNNSNNGQMMMVQVQKENAPAKLVKQERALNNSNRVFKVTLKLIKKIKSDFQ
jgi:hypothetical protein